MKIFKVGDRSKAMCSYCKKMVETTFAVKNVPVSHGKGSVSGVLAGVCNKCKKVISIPQQSAPRVREQLGTKDYSIEARIPQHLDDILLLVGDKLGAEACDRFQATVIKYYIDKLAGDSNLKRIKKYLKSDLATGKQTSRVSLKVSKSIHEEFHRILDHTGASKSDLIRAIALMAKDEILDKDESTAVTDLRKIANVA